MEKGRKEKEQRPAVLPGTVRPNASSAYNHGLSLPSGPAAAAAGPDPFPCGARAAAASSPGAAAAILQSPSRARVRRPAFRAWLRSPLSKRDIDAYQVPACNPSVSECPEDYPTGPRVQQCSRSSGSGVPLRRRRNRPGSLGKYERGAIKETACGRLRTGDAAHPRHQQP